MDIIAILQLLALPPLNAPLTLSLYLFTVSLPLSSFFVFAVLVEKTRDIRLNVWYKFPALLFGMMSSVGGMTLIIWNLSPTAGTLFVGMMILAVVFISYHISRADEADRQRK